jgi:hypothetical protein
MTSHGELEEKRCQDPYVRELGSGFETDQSCIVAEFFEGQLRGLWEAHSQGREPVGSWHSVMPPVDIFEPLFASPQDALLPMQPRQGSDLAHASSKFKICLHQCPHCVL